MIGLWVFAWLYFGLSELKRVSKVITKPGYCPDSRYRSDVPGRSRFLNTAWKLTLNDSHQSAEDAVLDDNEAKKIVSEIINLQNLHAFLSPFGLS